MGPFDACSSRDSELTFRSIAITSFAGCRYRRSCGRLPKIDDDFETVLFVGCSIPSAGASRGGHRARLDRSVPRAADVTRRRAARSASGPELRCKVLGNHAEVWFARDSPLERSGFELPVPLAKQNRTLRRKGRCRSGEEGCLECVSAPKQDLCRIKTNTLIFHSEFGHRRGPRSALVRIHLPPAKRVSTAPQPG